MPEGVWWWLVSKKKSAVNNLLLRWYPVVPSDRSGLNTEIYPSVPLDQKVPRWVTGCPKKRALALAKNTPPRQVQTSGADPSEVKDRRVTSYLDPLTYDRLTTEEGGRL
jgi:hypothetical protein